MIHWLQHAGDPLPDTRLALPAQSDAPGLLAAGGALTPKRLAEAYSKGVFPWYSEGQPVLWWSPNPRMVLWVDEFKLSRSLRKTIGKFVRSPDCEVRIDSDFDAVIRACAGTPRDGQDGTWIVGEMIDAYRRWHALGAVHSFETWVDGELVGGLYGVNLGRMFYGESMFAHRTDASKIAVAALICFCRAHGIDLIDCQQRTGHLASLGGRELPRAEFEAALTPRVQAAPIEAWTYDHRWWAQLSPPGADTAPHQNERP
jgi:leucyl/phenylalanyl-tRNA--protein transferase